MREALGLMCVVLLLATPTISLSDNVPSTVADGNVGQVLNAPPTETEVELVTVEIRGRVFVPNRVLLHHDHRTALRFLNHDTELHTVVAKEIFLSAGLNVGGNGFPEFGPDGLKRVIIPPEGLIEFQFTPARTGAFSYQCDMPGHDMKAAIVVE
jgi:plastocyanin